MGHYGEHRLRPGRLDPPPGPLPPRRPRYSPLPDLAHRHPPRPPAPATHPQDQPRLALERRVPHLLAAAERLWL